MNAQEAIERKEKQLEEQKAILVRYKEKFEMTHESNVEKVKRDIKYWEKQIECESIILESAKLFHKHTVPMLELSNRQLGFNEKPESVFGVPLESVGIEKGADE